LYFLSCWSEVYKVSKIMRRRWFPTSGNVRQRGNFSNFLKVSITPTDR
jgi:hypothetical protein